MTGRDAQLFIGHALSNSVTEVAQWSQYMDSSLAPEMKRADWSGLSVDMARYFAERVRTADWERWGFKDKTERDDMLKKMFRHVLRRENTLVAEVFLRADIDFNAGLANFHPIAEVLESHINDWGKAMLVAALVQKGIDKVQSRERLLETAVHTQSAQALRVLLPHMQYEMKSMGRLLLLDAALQGRKDIARLLVDEGGADVGDAIPEAKRRGMPYNWRLLEEVRDDVAKERARDAELAQLRQTVKELTAAVKEMQAPALDKPVISRPKVHGEP